MKLEFSRRIFEKFSNITFHENPPNGCRVVPCGWTDGWTDGRVGGRAGGRTDGRTGERANGRTGGRTDRQDQSFFAILRTPPKNVGIGRGILPLSPKCKQQNQTFLEYLIDVLISPKVHLPASVFICVCSVATSTHEIALHV